MNVFDIVVIAIALLVIVMSAKKGFVASCLDTFSMVISAFASYKLCKPIADSLYDMFIKDLVKTEFRQALDEMSSSLSVRDKVAGIKDTLPETAVKLARRLGFDVINITSALVPSTASNDTLIETIADTIAYDVMITLTEIVTFIALFIVASLLVRFISAFFSNNLEKLPVVGKVDTLLGGVLGVIKAVVLVFAGSVLVYIIVQTADAGSSLESIRSSQFYMFMEQYNPIIDVLKG